MATMKFKFVIELEGAEIFTQELGSEDLSSLAGQLPDVSENKDIFWYLAQCASSEVRSDIVYKDNLNEETIELLSKDASIDVKRRLCGQKTFHEWASLEIVLEYISADINCAKTIAENVGEFINADINKVGIELCKHSDPDVRNALANSYNTSKKFVKQLLSDPDASVRASAKRKLS